MTNFTLNVTNRCNFQCKTCLRVRATAQDMPPEDVARILPGLKRMGVQHLALTGGEPILNSSLPEIIKLLVAGGMTFHVVTNGWFGEDYLRVLDPFRNSVKHISVSLDGHDAATHDANRKPGSFDRAWSSTRLYREHGYPIVISHVLNHLNAPHLLRFLQFMNREHLGTQVGFALATGSNQNWLLTEGQRAALRYKLPPIKKMYGDWVTFTADNGLSPHLPFCQNFYLMNDLMLRFDGRVCFCCDALPDNDGAVLGDIRSENFDDILVRFGDVLAVIVRARLTGILRGERMKTNDCDFCNQIMRTVSRRVS